MASTRPDRPLTPRQERFVQEYLIDLNATQAAIRAGYAPKRADAQSYQLLANPRVRSAVATGQARRSQRTEITADRVLQELACLAFADPREVFEWGPEGVRLRPSDEIPESAARAVAEVSESTTKEGGSIRAKLHSKTDALKLLGQHLGMFDEAARTQSGINIMGDGAQVLVDLRGLLALRQQIAANTNGHNGNGNGNGHH